MVPILHSPEPMDKHTARERHGEELRDHSVLASLVVLLAELAELHILILSQDMGFSWPSGLLGFDFHVALICDKEEHTLQNGFATLCT